MDARDHEGFIGCPFFICAPAVSRSLHSPSSFFPFDEGRVFLSRDIPVASRLLDNRRGKTSSVVNVLDTKGYSLDIVWIKMHEFVKIAHKSWIAREGDVACVSSVRRALQSFLRMIRVFKESRVLGGG